MTGPVDLSQSFDGSALAPTGRELARVPAAAVAAAGTLPAPDQASALVELAIREKVDVSVIERLVALQEHVTERNARMGYFQALAAFQAECPPILKTKRVSYVTKSGGRVEYDFAPLDVIAKTIRPFLLKHGFSYTFDTDAGTRGVLVVGCTLRHIEGHSERSTFSVPIDDDSKRSAAQNAGAALTYGRRMALVSVLGLVTADPDSDAAPVMTQEEIELITPEQTADLESLMDEVKAKRAKFLEWLGLECRGEPIRAVSEIRKGELQRAIAALESRRKSA